MVKFKDKYRIETTRLPGWDYAALGWYFVTICVKNREPVFGRIQNGEMLLSPLGEIAHQFLADIPQHFPHASIDAWVVMPNHVHAIVIIHNTVVETPHVETPHVETPHVASLQQQKREFGPLAPGSLSKIVQAYKAAVTRQAHQNGHADFAWQERFYDHIIRDEDSLQNIRVYIVANPVKWEDDEYYSKK
jgi:putative transposase